MSLHHAIFVVPCPECGERQSLAVTVTHDPGCWRTANGDGWPETWEYDTHTEECIDCGAPVNEAWNDRIDAAFADWRKHPIPGEM